MAVTDKNLIPGGSFLIQDTLPKDMFTPEDLNDEQNFRRACLSLPTADDRAPKVSRNSI